MTVGWFGIPPGPAPVTGVTVTRLYGTNIRVSWNPSMDEYHKRYKVFRSEDNFETETLLITTTKTEYKDSSLMEGSYQYRIVDVDIHGMESQPSAPATLTIGELLPFMTTEDVTGSITFDMYTELGRKAISGTVENKGPNPATVELSYDGIMFPRAIQLEPYDIVSLYDSKDRIAIHSIRITSLNATVSVVAT